jgi:ComF family protein
MLVDAIHFALEGFFRPLRDVLFPPLCVVCENLLTGEEEHVCASCFSAIRPVLETDPTYQDSRRKLTSTGIISDLVAAYYFEPGGPLQTIVHHVKYNGMTSLGTALGRRLGERVKLDRPGEKVSGIIPVPLHFSKRRERGYNQSEVICRGIASVLDVPVAASVVLRRVYTQSQTKLNSEERQRNVAGAFSIQRQSSFMLKDATLLLVDDVVTTGATMQSCAQVLIEGGAKRVIGCAVALAV